MTSINRKSDGDFIKEIGAVAVVIEVRKSIDGIKGEILYVIENQTKDWKRKGQHSIILGTVEGGETLLQAVNREAAEEAGINISVEEKQKKGTFELHAHTKEGIIKVTIHVFHILLSEKPIIKNNNPNEIQDIRFVTREHLKEGNGELLRPGAVESILLCGGADIEKNINVSKGGYIEGMGMTLEGKLSLL